MKRITMVAALAAAAFCAAYVAGCDEGSESSYSVTMKWEVGGYAGYCEPSVPEYLGGGKIQIDSVSVDLFKSKADADAGKEPMGNNSATCDEGSIIISNLSKGSYYAKMLAYGTHENADVPDGGPTPSTDRLKYYVADMSINVPAVEDTPYVFELKPNTAKVTVGWDFDKFSCTQNGVQKVNVELTGARHNYSSDKIDCTQETFLFETVEWDTYSISVEGYADGVTPVMTGQWCDDADTDCAFTPPDVCPDNCQIILVRPGDEIDENTAYVTLTAP